MPNKAESDWQAFRRYEPKDVRVIETTDRIVFTHKDVSYTGMALQINLMGFLVVPLIVAMVAFGYGLHVLTPLTIRSSPVLNVLLSFCIPLGVFLVLLRKLVSFQSELTIEPGVVTWNEKVRKLRRGNTDSPVNTLMTAIGYTAALLLAVVGAPFTALLALYVLEHTGFPIWDERILFGNLIFDAVIVLTLLGLYVTICIAIYRHWRRRLAERPVSRPGDGIVIPVNEIRAVDVRLGEEFNSSTGNFRKYKVVIWHGPVPIYTIAAGNEDTVVMLKEGVVAAIGVLNARFAQAGPRGRTPAWE